jgi:membrane protease YdiL (CAAX protease family)
MGRRAAAWALGITAAFMIVRFGVYAAFPADDWSDIDMEAWTRRDMLMCAPRALALAACLWAMARLGGRGRWGWHGALTPESAVLLCAMTAAYGLIDATTGQKMFLWSQALRGLGANAFVVLWEEACYRGLLYGGLRQRWPPARAAPASSAVFMVMHLQSQPFEVWPWIFCFGVIGCAALEAGAGLPWLMAAHWIVDIPSVACRADVAADWRRCGQYALAGLAVIALLYLKDASGPVTDAPAAAPQPAR